MSYCHFQDITRYLSKVSTFAYPTPSGVCRGGPVVRASDLQPMQVQVPAAPLHERPWASCSHTCASVHRAV